MTNFSTKSGAARLSVISNATLVVLKLVVGIATGSVSVLSEAVHSTVDLAAAGIALFSVRMAERPADVEHPYGHGKVENVSAVIEALLIFGAAAYIVFEAYHRLFPGAGTKPRSVFEPDMPMAVMGFSAVANWLISRHLMKVALDTDSPAILADAHHLRVDVWTSVGVMLTMGLIWLTHAWVLDPIIALMVAGLICKVAWELTREAGGSLLDESLPRGEQDRLRQVLDNDHRVIGYHRVRARKAGGQRQIDLHILLDPHLSLSAAHAQAEGLEDEIREAFPNTWVVTHMEPATEAELVAHSNEPGMRKGPMPHPEATDVNPHKDRPVGETRPAAVSSAEGPIS